MHHPQADRVDSLGAFDSLGDVEAMVVTDLEALAPTAGSVAPLEEELIVLPRRASAAPRLLQSLRQTSRAASVRTHPTAQGQAEYLEACLRVLEQPVQRRLHRAPALAPS